MQDEKRRGKRSEEQKENRQAGNPLGEASVASLMVKFAAVSDTHLDVYKRQV